VIRDLRTQAIHSVPIVTRRSRHNRDDRLEQNLLQGHVDKGCKSADAKNNGTSRCLECPFKTECLHVSKRKQEQSELLGKYIALVRLEAVDRFVDQKSDGKLRESY
jgi:hypothetical protein